ncbi:MAG: helix-turn-helix domain-containing protein [Pseudomonadota bacterium]
MGGKRDKDGESWQQQKSAMTRERILDAAVACFIDRGYGNTTTAVIADQAAVSRGAMLHHFPTKTGLMQAAIEHLHGRMVALYRAEVEAIPEGLSVDERNRRGLKAYWRYLSSDLFTAYHELTVAGRTDQELKDILNKTATNFAGTWEKANDVLFPEWTARGELYSLAMDITQFVMEGMAVSPIATNRQQRVKRILDYLGDRLEEIFHEGDDDAAIARHARK